jgi:hypothetical protein
MNWSDKQLRIFEEWENTRNNLAISAAPGSGKSTTLIELLKRTPAYKKSIFLAFNKSIQQELELKVPEGVQTSTLHSLGFRTLLKNTQNKYKVNEIKNWILGKKVLNLSFKNTNKESAYLFTISKLVDLYRLNMCSSKKELIEVADKYGIDYFNGEIDHTLKLLDYLKNYNQANHEHVMMIDYVDMLYLPILLISESKFPKYNIVMIDECQDLNALQWKLVQNIFNKRTRFCAVGDPHQCQPIGTKILMKNGTTQSIENLQIGDEVISYDTHHRGSYVGYRNQFNKNGSLSSNYKKKSPAYVKNIDKRFYRGDLITVQVNDNTSQYTPNHKCLVRWRSDKTNGFALYLMQKQNYFRIGITPLWTKNKQGSVTMRAKAENADKMWILNIYPTKREAYFAEQYFSILYSMPQMIFTLRQQAKTLLTQQEIEQYYQLFNTQTLYNNALKILQHHNKDIDLPFWHKTYENYNSKLHMFKTFACNIFKDYMQMIVFDPTHTITYRNYKRIVPKYDNIQHLTTTFYNDYVYSLEINKFHTYVADNILTHNSIYSFMGADKEVFDSIKNYKNTTVLPLSYSYRCPTNIVKEANRVFDFIESPPGQHEGEVIEKGSLEDVKEGDFILCRNNTPLFETFLELLKMGRKAYIMGKDYGNGLLKVLSKLDTFEEEDRDRMLDEKIKKLEEKGIQRPKRHSSYISLQEKLDILFMLHDHYEDEGKLRGLIGSMFAESEQKGAILLSTIHKSKGLESDNVYILQPDLIPSQYAETPLELYQESCLLYVAITRAKKKLIYL